MAKLDATLLCPELALAGPVRPAGRKSVLDMRFRRSLAAGAVRLA
jgi:hypothetical protein